MKELEALVSHSQEMIEEAKLMNEKSQRLRRETKIMTEAIAYLVSESSNGGRPNTTDERK